MQLHRHLLDSLPPPHQHYHHIVFVGIMDNTNTHRIGAGFSAFVGNDWVHGKHVTCSTLVFSPKTFGRTSSMEKQHNLPYQPRQMEKLPEVTTYKKWHLCNSLSETNALLFIPKNILIRFMQIKSTTKSTNQSRESTLNPSQNDLRLNRSRGGTHFCLRSSRGQDLGSSEKKSTSKIGFPGVSQKETSIPTYSNFQPSISRCYVSFQGGSSDTGWSWGVQTTFSVCNTLVSTFNIYWFMNLCGEIGWFDVCAGKE